MKRWKNTIKKRLLKAQYENFTGLILDYAIKTGRYSEAFLINERYIEDFPNTSHLYSFKAEILMFLDKRVESLEFLERNNPLHSDNMFYLRGSARLYFLMGEYEMSNNQLTKIRSKFPNENPPILIWLDAVFTKMNGNNEKANQYIDQLVNLYKTHSSGSPAWFISLYYCYFKDYENTFIWLQKSYDRHEVEMTWLREEPVLIPIRKDQKYKDLYNKVGFSKVE